MEKITKKAFIETLKTREHFFGGTTISLSKAGIEQLVTEIKPEKIDQIRAKGNRRAVIVEQSNALQFTGGSWLYFKNYDEYFRHGEILIAYSEEHFWMLYILA